jgi:hypothetical protein
MPGLKQHLYLRQSDKRIAGERLEIFAPFAVFAFHPESEYPHLYYPKLTSNHSTLPRFTLSRPGIGVPLQNSGVEMQFHHPP